MKKEEYQAYIESRDWFEKRKTRMMMDQNICFVCELSPDECCINVHHLTYERIGHEDMDDLISLCIRCHKDIHRRPTYDKKSLYAMREEYIEKTTPPPRDNSEIEKRRGAAEQFLAIRNL